MKKKSYLPLVIIIIIAVAIFLNYITGSQPEAPRLTTDTGGVVTEAPTGQVSDNPETEIPSQEFFKDLFERREKAREEGDVQTFNSLISNRGLEAQIEVRKGSTDEAFSQTLIGGYRTMERLSIIKIPFVELLRDGDKILLVYEGPVTTLDGEERFFTRLVEFVLESDQWKIDRDYIDGDGGEPRVIPPPRPKVTITPN